MPMNRKARTEEFLRENGIPVNEELPPIVSENEADIKSAEKIAKRAVTAFLASLIALEIEEGENAGKAAALFGQYLRAFELEDEQTPDEKRLFDLGRKLIPFRPDREFTNMMVGRIERAMALFWSCGLIEGDLGYPSGVSLEDANSIAERLSKAEHFGRIMAAVTLHSMSEILENADQAYRMYSACRDAESRGEEPPADLATLVLREQHKGFNWIIGDYDKDGWDSVSEMP